MHDRIVVSSTPYWIIWLVTGTIAALSASLFWQAAHLGTEYLPVGNDSFYHARRILDTVRDFHAFYEFDPRIHAPEGSLLTWPWGYDFAMACIVRVFLSLGFTSNPMAILVWIPVAAVFVSSGLLILIAHRLRFSLWATALAGLCMALSPLTQYLHGTGIIDHHYAEYIFVLATVWATLGWLYSLDNRLRALLLGLILGLAPAVHNGLFILQAPVIASIALLWFSGIAIPKHAANAFAAGLVGAMIVVLLPSLPFRSGNFEYYLLSWFHLYIAFATSVLVLLAARQIHNARGLIVVGGAALLLAIPIIHQALMARSFLGGSSIRLNAIGEMRSVYRISSEYGGLWNASAFYSFFLWLIPATAIYCAVMLWKERTQGRAAFWLFSIFGLTLLLLQFRLHYFGSFALYLPLLVWADSIKAHRKAAMLITSMTVLLLYYPPLRYQLIVPVSKANDSAFANVWPILQELRKVCSHSPGIVLADSDAGHYIRYYTECSVVANNFLLTKQHGDKVELTDQLFASAGADVPRLAPYIRYILVRPVNIVRAGKDDFRYVSYSPKSSRLIGDLLFEPPTSKSIPTNFRLLFESRFADVNDIPYARLFEILPSSDSPRPQPETP